MTLGQSVSSDDVKHTVRQGSQLSRQNDRQPTTEPTPKSHEVLRQTGFETTFTGRGLSQ
jgi:hypothetical protein